MRFRNVIKENLQARERRKHTWQKWFAWFPVRTWVSGREEYVWLETIERRLVDGWNGDSNFWIYEVPKK